MQQVAHRKLQQAQPFPSRSLALASRRSQIGDAFGRECASYALLVPGYGLVTEILAPCWHDLTPL
jgi:hypothetical protein